jgi:nitrite reductase/ring-hydroxylating ferredoxin subunit
VAPTAATGLADWSELGDFRRPRRIGLVHASANAVTTLVYAASWRARARGDHGRGVVLALLGSAGLVVGGYLGGHLSYSEGVGVNRNADRSPEPADWTDAGPAADVAEGGLHRVEVDGQPVLLTRRGDEVLAIGAVCSHYGGPLEEGELTAGGECVVCPWHASEFRLRDGAVARGPATAPQPLFEVRTDGDRLQVRAASLQPA